MYPSSRRCAVASAVAVAAAFLSTLIAPQPAEAISFDVNGKIVGWNITPFSQANGNTTSGGITSVRQNDFHR